MLRLPLFNYFPIIEIGSAKVEVFLIFPKFIFIYFGDLFRFK
jgi:hypothetical protein